MGKWCIKNLFDDTYTHSPIGPTQLSSYELDFPGKYQGHVADVYSQTRYLYKSTQLL